MIALLNALSTIVLSQQSKQSKPPIDFDAIDHWVSLGDNNDVSISNDGKYVAYTINNRPYKKSTLVIQATDNSWKKEFIDATPIMFSGDSKQFIFQTNDSLGFLSLGQPSMWFVNNIDSYKIPRLANGGFNCEYFGVR